MPFNGSGVFTRLRNWQADAAALIKIRSDLHDSEDDNFAAGLSLCLTRDGQSSPTADINMNSMKLINLAAPANPTDAVNKAYVDDIKTFPTALTLAGGNLEGRVNFTGTQGPTTSGQPLGFSFTQADLFSGVKPADVEVVGRLPRFVWNDKVDGSGTDIMTLEDTGNLSITGAFASAGALSAAGILKGAGGRVVAESATASFQPSVAVHSANRATAYGMWNSTAGVLSFGATDGNGVPATQYGYFQGGNFLVTGYLRAAGVVYSGNGAAYLSTDGNLAGPIWPNWGANDAFNAIGARIESRAQAWAASEANARFHSSRMAGFVQYVVGAGTHLPSGYVCTGMHKGAQYDIMGRQPQLYSNNAGWVVAFPY